MKRRWLQYLALGCVVALGACGSNDDEPTALNAPEMKVVPATFPGCDFSIVKNSIATYFPSAEKSLAQGYESSMETGDEAVRRANGFLIMDLIGSVSRKTALSSTKATTGSNLTKALTKCMFDTSKPEYTSLHNGDGIGGIPFDSALTTTAGGVYYVVGAGRPDSLDSKVLAGGIPSAIPANRLSAVGPGSSSGAVGSWTSVLAGNTFEGGTALVYGYPVSVSPIVYEWATIDPSTTFSPYAFISICDGSSDSTFMVHESNVGVLGYSTTNLCGLPDATGTATKYKSNFKNTSVETINVEWVSTPPSPFAAKTFVTFVARATTQVEIGGQLVTQGVNNTCLSISGTNNNGVGTELQGTKECDANKVGKTVVTALTKTDDALGAGYASFRFQVTKTGGLVLNLAGRQVVDRSDEITFVNPLALKYVVNPK